MNEVKKNRFLFFISLVIFLFFVFLCSFSSHAAADQDYFPMYQNHNGNFSEELKVNIANQFDSTNNYVFVMYRYYQANVGRHHYYVLYFPKNSDLMFYGEKYNNLYQFSLYKLGSGSWWQGSFWTSNNSSTINGISGNGNTPSWWSGLESSNYNSGIDYVSNFTLYTNNSDTRQIVLLYDDGVSIPEGDTARDDMEKPDINDYIPDWSDTPIFDGSSVENALQSVYNGVVWLGDNIKGTITGIGEYISDTLRWGLQRVIDTIRDKIDDLKSSINGFLSSINGFLSDIKGFVNYITEPLDLNEVESALSGSTSYGLVSVGVSFKNTFNDYFDSITAPTSLSFHIPYTILTKSGYIDFDFSWYAGIRDSVLPWIVGFLYAGFGLALFRSFPSIVHGISGVLQKGG